VYFVENLNGRETSLETDSCKDFAFLEHLRSGFDQIKGLRLFKRKETRLDRSQMLRKISIQ